MVRRESKERVFALADKNLSRQTDVEEIKIGSTTYIVNGYFAASGVTVSEKSSVYLTRKPSGKPADFLQNLTLFLTFDII